MSTEIQRIKNYYNSPHVNASLLKGLHNPKWIKFKRDNPDIEDDEKRHFRIGGAIDSILTSPSTFSEEYHVSYKERPSGLMGIFIDALPLDLTEESDTEEYREAYDASGYRVSIESIIKKLWKVDKYKDYYISRKNGQGKSILSYDEWEEVLHCKDYILNNPFCSRYFINNESAVELIHQVPIYFQMEETMCKGLLDGVLIDHNKKKIIPFDLKTIGRSIFTFPNSYLRYGYYLQGAFYRKGLEVLIKDKGEGYIDHSEFPLISEIEDYDIDYMKFIVTEKKAYHSNPARIFNTSEKDYKIGLKGGYSSNSKYYKGIEQLLDDYKWHLKTNDWDLPKALIESEGEVDLNVF